MSQNNVRILVVDDDASMRQTIAMVLSKAGYTVVQAQNGETALALLDESHAQDTPFDVILTDIVMHAIDGVAVTRAARSLPNPPEVILLTRHGKLETAMAAIDAGAAGYLLKPLQWHMLLQRVVTAIEHRRSTQTQREQAQAWQRILGIIGDAPPHPAATANPEPAQRYLTVGSLQIDTFRREVQDQGRLLDLTPVEYTILATLAASPSLIIPYSTLVGQTHQLDVDNREAYQLLRTHTSNLRRKLQSCRVVSIRGVGYMLDGQRDASDAPDAGD